MDRLDIPERPYFRIGQVARLLGLEAYVLRYWESRFPQLRPTRAPSGHRIYRRRDLELLLRIKRLVYDQGFTLAGARRRLEEEAADPQGQEVLAELREILEMID